MTGAEIRLTVEELNNLTQKWWETSVIDATGTYVWDEEIKTVNAMADEIETFPRWALRVRDAMPRYGFEMCSHRWLDGLDNAICMIGAEDFCPSTAGTCGDVPGRVVHAAEGCAKAVQDWIEGTTTAQYVREGQVAEWLGDQTPEKTEAATCFVELVRGFLCGVPAGMDRRATASDWRERRDQNQILGDMFEGEGFDCLLECGCGFKILDRLDSYIHMIGGDQSQAAERHGICNSQLRFLFRDDPERYEVTRGYLWGLDAYLAGRDEDWLSCNKPECAGAAAYALHNIRTDEGPTPLRRWLVASLLKSAKIWCQRTLELTPADLVPAYARDLPTIAAKAAH